MIVASRQTSMRTQITCLLILSLTISPALAWNGTGHKIIASIAFRQLTAEEQAKIVSMLKRHPRFSADFADAMPDEVRRGSDAEQNEWLFQQAAIWPDTVRSGAPEKQAFNRSEWHYINLPVFLTDEARLSLVEPLMANMATDPPADATLDTARTNVLQVIRFARNRL